MSLCFESRSAQSFLLKSHGDLAASQLWMTNHRGLRLILTLLECEMRALDGANLCQESSNHCDVSLIWFFDRSHKFVQGKEEPRETVCTGGLTWNVIGHIHTHQSDMVNHGLKLASKQGGWLTGLAVSQETKKRNTNSLGGLPDAAACGSCHKGPTSVHGIRGTHKPRPSLCSVSVKTGKSNPHFQTIHSDWQTCNHVNTYCLKNQILWPDSFPMFPQHYWCDPQGRKTIRIFSRLFSFRLWPTSGQKLNELP